jgi:NSS family neurotransmitter:Na+ symporter
VGYILKPRAVIEEIEESGKFTLKKLFVVVIRYIAPVCLVAVLVSSILSAFGVITI